MATSRTLTLFALLLTTNASGAAAQNAQRWWRDIQVLAHDSMRGRQSASPEHREAAEYVAAQFKAAGLEPGARAGYLQPVYLTRRATDESGSSLTLLHAATEEQQVLGEDASISIRTTIPESDGGGHEAGLVFAGYGLHLPQLGHDDFAGRDVRGKIVVYMSRTPRGIPGQVIAHARNQAWQMLREKGAVGMIALGTTASDTAFVRSQRNRTTPQLSLTTGGGAFITLLWNPARGDKLFSGAARSYAAIRAAADSLAPLPGFELPVRIRYAVKVNTSEVVSDNVVGILRGTDPKLRDEYVVLTAHLDHIGVGRPVDDDSIYNGAMDNASGTALLMESARRMREQNIRTRRSIVFLAVTAEEHGLLGSRYFAQHPTVPGRQIVANLNTDMFMPIVPLTMIMVNGLEESNLADDARRAGAKLGLKVVTDPEPEENRFVRSDQYSFILNRVPALSFKVGFARNSPEHRTVLDFRAKRYHQPADQTDQPVNLETAEGFTRFYLGVVREVANRSTRPSWLPNSFFR